MLCVYSSKFKIPFAEGRVKCGLKLPPRANSYEPFKPHSLPQLLLLLLSYTSSFLFFCLTICEARSCSICSESRLVPSRSLTPVNSPTSHHAQSSLQQPAPLPECSSCGSENRYHLQYLLRNRFDSKSTTVLYTSLVTHGQCISTRIFRAKYQGGSTSIS
jgi:hypothetical protein